MVRTENVSNAESMGTSQKIVICPEKNVQVNHKIIVVIVVDEQDILRQIVTRFQMWYICGG